MALLGSSVDPRLFMQDYSGFTRAAEIQAQGMQNLGASIGGAIESYAEAKEKRKKIDASTKASRAGIESAIKLGEAYGIDVKSSLEPILAKMDDPNTTPMEAAMYGEEAKNRITNVLNMGITASERENAQQRAMMEQQYKAAQLGLQAEKVDIARQQASKGPAPKFEIRRPTITSPTGEVFEGPELPYDESRGMYFDPKVRKYIADPNLIGTGQEYAPDSAMPTSTSQVMPSDGKFGFTYNTRDKLPASTANARQISLDFNAAANKNAKGIEIIIPNNASDIERALALDYVNKTKDFFASKGVDVPVRGVRTAAENKRGSVNRFHTEPFFVNDAASRAAIESDPDGYAQVLASTIGKIPGAMFIPPHKSNDPGASANGINERDFAKGVLIPALERLSNQSSTAAIGTPQQQTEVARMIEQGAGMATAQNIPQGAMPTEPSMATQQPQLPQQAAPQWTPPPGFRPARPKGEAVMMTSEQVKNLEGQGFRVSAIPNPDGTFMVSGVTTGGSSSGFEVTTPEGTTVRYGGSGGLAQPKVAPGEQLVPDPTSPTGTRVVQIPGGEAEKAAKQEASAAEAARKRGTELGLVALSEIDNFIDYTDKMSKLPFASPIRQAFATLGMEQQAEAESSLNTVKSNLKFEALDALRKASPSGASGLGQVTQNEFSALAEQWGDLRLKGDPEKIKERAIRIKKQLLDVVHGDQKHRDALLKSGAISQQQYNEIQSQYPGAKQVSQEDANLQRWRNTFTPKPTQ